MLEKWLNNDFFWSWLVEYPLLLGFVEAHYCNVSEWTFSLNFSLKISEFVIKRGFQDFAGGGGGRAGHLTNFFQKMHENEEILGQRGGMLYFQMKSCGFEVHFWLH